MEYKIIFRIIIIKVRTSTIIINKIIKLPPITLILIIIIIFTIYNLTLFLFKKIRIKIPIFCPRPNLLEVKVAKLLPMGPEVFLLYKAKDKSLISNI
jgi:hypothetical protein